MAWLNNDGLYLKYGTERTTANKGGSYRTSGALRQIELRIDLTALTTANTILSDTTELPSGIRIEEVEIVTNVAATTASSAALNVGTIRKDRTTVIDADGIVEALAVTAMSEVGEKTVLRIPVAGTAVGDQLDETTTYPCYLIASTSTGTFTAGTATVRISYTTP